MSSVAEATHEAQRLREKTPYSRNAESLDNTGRTRGLSVKVIENALVLAAARRLIRPADAPPLGTIRSLAYFLPVIEEVLGMRVRSGRLGKERTPECGGTRADSCLCF